MARRPRSDLDTLLNAWAVWCESGGVSQGRSMLAKLIDNQGLLINGTGGGVPIDSVEARIDSLVAELSVSDLMAADVLRLEYGAGLWQVLKRRGVRGYDPRRPDREMKAAALNISGRTYRRRLMVARQAVIDGLSGEREG